MLLLIALGLMVCGKVVLNSFVGDDFGYINHPYIVNQNLAGLFMGSSADLGGDSPVTGHFYRPLMLLVFSIINLFFGTNAFFYHLVSLIFHIINGILIYVLLKKIINRPLAFFVSFLFLIHPITVESYAYSSNLQDLLFVFFGLLSLLSKKLVLSLLFLTLSMFSKETGIVFLIVTPFYRFLYLKVKNYYEHLSYLVVLVIYLIVRVGIAQVTFNESPLSPVARLDFIERLKLIPEIFSYYFSTVIFPKDLAIAQVWTFGNINIITSSVIVLLFLLLIYIGLKTPKVIRRSFIFFFIWFTIGLIPHLQIIPLEMTVADRWFYFPLIGMLGMLGVVLDSLYKRKMSKKIIVTMLIIIIICFSLRTFIRISDWKDAQTLYRTDLKTKNSFLLQHSLGYELMEEGKIEDSFKHLDASVNLYKTPFNTNSFGVWYYKNKDYENAEKWFRQSISLGDYFLAYKNLSILLLEAGKTKDASLVLNLAIRKFPGQPIFYQKLSISEYLNGNLDKALEAAATAYNLSPTKENEYVFHQLLEGKEIKINK